jgi:sugar transferase (PEP-CTERM system associated)
MVALTLLGQLAVVQLDRRLASALFNDRLFQRRVLVLGAGREAARIGARLRRRSDRRGFELLAYVSLGEGTRIPGAESAPVLPIAQLDLPEFCREHGIEEIVVATDDRRGDGAQAPLPVDALLTCRTAGILVTELVRFLEREAGRVDLDVLRPSWLLFSPGFTLPLRMGLKRTVDVAASLVLLAVSWPVMIVTALAIRLEDGGSAPVLYRQTRVGLRGRRFRVLKFRSMCVDAERLGQPQWADREDPRITRTGGFIRALRIDELPQLFNVLRGDMSLVGPRPERPEFVDRFDREIPFYGARHSVKPGLTGWAQLNYPYGSSDEDARRKLEFDLYYVKNYSVALDLMIMIRTVEVVLFGRGAR